LKIYWHKDKVISVFKFITKMLADYR